MRGITNKSVGKRFNRLTVIEDLGLFENGLRKVMAKCDCGVVKRYYFQHLKKGTTKSCGCHRKERGRNCLYVHGLSNHPLINVWSRMKARCCNPLNKKYSDYGGRGVRVCDEWMSDFMPFFNWCISNGWKRGMQIDKDILGDGLLYSPNTCSIITCKENQNHKRSNLRIEYNGETKTASQWAEQLGFMNYTISARLRKGWSIEKTMTTPMKIQKNSRNLRYN